MFIESENGKSRLLDPRTASLQILNKGRTPNPKSKFAPLEIPDPRIQSPIADFMPTSSGQRRDKSEYESPFNGEESLLSSLPWRERVRRVLSEVERVGGRNSSQSYNRKSTVQASDEYPITLSVSLPLP